MLSEEQVARFTRDGFLNGGTLLSADTVDYLSEELDRIIAKGPDGFGDDEPQPVRFADLNAGGYEDPSGETTAVPVWQIVNVWEASAVFAELVREPAVVEAIHQLTGFGDLQVWHDQVQYKPADVGGSTQWHQDAPKWPSIEPMTPVSAWIPLDDADEANGCMWMVPGSHRWGNVDRYLGGLGLTELDDFARVGDGFEWPDGVDPEPIAAVPCPVRRGEVHFHHSLTWHGSPRNRSDRPRRAVAIHYMTSEAVYTGRSHLMQRFIEVDQGEAMAGAGPHFPMVMRDGRVVRGNRRPMGGRP